MFSWERLAVIIIVIIIVITSLLSLLQVSVFYTECGSDED